MSVGGGEQRTLQVPEGLSGERVDVGLARMFGISRSKAADLVARELVTVDGRAAAKSDRLVPGAVLDVTFPREPDPLEVRAEVVEGIGIIHDDDDIVVIDKPVGVAVHPSMGWTGPTVVGHLRGAGYQIATSGAPERAGDRAATRRRYVGGDGHRQERGGLLAAEERLPPSRGRQDLPRAGAGTPRSAGGHHRRADRPAPEVRLEVHGPRGRQAQRDPLLDARGAPVREPAGGAPRDRPHPPDPGAHGRAEAPVRRGPHLRRRPDAGRAASGWNASGCTPCGSASSTLAAGTTSSTSRRTRPTWRAPWRSSAMPTDDAPGDIEFRIALRRTCRPCTRSSSRRARDLTSPPERRTPQEVRAWIDSLLDGHSEVWLACRDDEVLGFLLLRGPG